MFRELFTTIRSALPGASDTSQNPEAILFNLFKHEAEQGNAEAQCHLGKMYLEGRGVSQDHAEVESDN